jgi:hypothetical protein
MSSDPEEMPTWMTMLFAIASGLLAANIYYSQPIAELIATSLGFSSSATGLIVAFTQAGFGIGQTGPWARWLLHSMRRDGSRGASSRFTSAVVKGSRWPSR